MRAEQFYQSQSQQATPVYLVSKSQLETSETDFSPFERSILQTQQFSGKTGDVCLLSDDQGRLNKVYIAIGENQDAEAVAIAINKIPPGCYQIKQSMSALAMANWALEQYRFDRYKAAEAQPRVLVVDEPMLTALLNGVRSIFLVRDLINTPTNDLTPERLADEMANLAKQHKAEFTQWIGDELLAANFPAIHVVGRASEHAPRLLTLNWGKAKNPLVTLVGKGVCFDSGGLDLKPASAMRLMKKDMGGAAHALGLAQWIMARKLPVRLQVLIPAVENSISGNAYRPGDVLTMRNGKTVEIDNTDAEGRLILADALVRAGEEKPDLLIDFATLTGAARVAVGTDIAAMFTNNHELAQALIESARETVDPIWHLPLFAGYDCLLDSTVADMVNSSPSPYAGAITAALFLKRFVPADTPWVHFDLMAWNVTRKPGKPEGGEAMAIRAIAHYLQKRYS